MKKLAPVVCDLTAVGQFTDSVWRLILEFCFGACSNFVYNLYAQSDVSFLLKTKTFTFTSNLHALLRGTARGVYHTVSALWRDDWGFSSARELMFTRQAVHAYAPGIINIIIAARFNNPSLVFWHEKYDMESAKHAVEDARSGEAFGFKGDEHQIDVFFEGFNNYLLYAAIAHRLNQLLRFDDLASIESSNFVATLLIHGFLRDGVGNYLSGGLSMSDASVQLIFCVLKRVLVEGRFLPGWTWMESVPLLFEYPEHSRQWADMQGFKMFCYMMYRNTAYWALCSNCFYNAASEAGAEDVYIVDHVEFGALLTSMLTSIALVWQDNTALLLSIARLLVAWRYQHNDLEVPPTLVLEILVGSPCCTGSMKFPLLPWPICVLDCTDEYEYAVDRNGFIYKMTDKFREAFALREDWTTLESGCYTLLRSGEFRPSSGELHLQVLNSFVLWLLSRFPASQLGEHAEAIHKRMQIWGCGPGCTSDEHPCFIVSLKLKLGRPADRVSAPLKRTFSQMQ